MPNKRYYDKMQEDRDAQMIGTARGFAGMPQNVIMKSYPKSGTYLPENLNDGISGIDSQVSKAENSVKSHMSTSKF